MENEPKKRGRGRPRTNVQHYRYAASFPLDCWDYLLDASFRDSTPKDRVSVQQYLNRLIYADMKKHHWTPEATTNESKVMKIMVDGEVDQPIEGQITTEEIEPKPADKPKKAKIAKKSVKEDDPDYIKPVTFEDDGVEFNAMGEPIRKHNRTREELDAMEKKKDDSGDPWDQMNEYQEKQAKKDSKK